MERKLQTIVRIVSVRTVEKIYAATNVIQAKKMLDQAKAKVNVVNAMLERKITNELQHDFIIVKFFYLNLIYHQTFEFFYVL